jgi:N-acylneuraminate cytidylyltransferase
VVKRAGVLAIVPARGGSKSIPRKNIRRLGGVPLLAYSIEAGLTARSVDRVIVSTEDEEIAAVARRCGAEVPFLRPQPLAEDTTPDCPVFVHALEWLEAQDGWLPEVVIHLRPTSPLRPIDCVDRALQLLHSDPAADSVRGVVLASQNPYKMWRLQPDGTMTPLLDATVPEPYNQPRQALPPTYWQTGHIDAVRAATVLERGSMSGSRIRALPIDAAYSCDLDTEADWQRIEWTLAHFDRPYVRPPTHGMSIPRRDSLVV